MNATFEGHVPVTKSKAARSAKRKILLVNDDPAMRRVLVRMLALEDFLVLVAANGDQAIKFAKMTRFDLVLVNLKSPLEDEWENLGPLAAQNPLQPVILITDRHSEYFHAMASGVAALLEKPVNLVTLIHTIHLVLEEPIEEHQARFLGQPAAFHYFPSGTDKVAEAWGVIDNQ